MIREVGPHAMACPVQPAHHRARRNAERGGRVVIGKRVDIDELHHLAKLRRQRPESEGDPRNVVGGCGLVLGARRGRVATVDFSGHVGAVSEKCRALAAVAVDVGVAHDREEPRPRRAAIEGVQRTKRSQEGVLDQVLGVVRVGRDRARDTEEHLEVRGDDGIEARCSCWRAFRCCVAWVTGHREQVCSIRTQPDHHTAQMPQNSRRSYAGTISRARRSGR